MTSFLIIKKTVGSLFARFVCMLLFLAMQNQDYLNIKKNIDHRGGINKPIVPSFVLIV